MFFTLAVSSLSFIYVLLVWALPFLLRLSLRLIAVLSGAYSPWASLKTYLAELFGVLGSEDRHFRSFVLVIFPRIFFFILPGDNQPGHHQSKKKTGVLDIQLVNLHVIYFPSSIPTLSYA